MANNVKSLGAFKDLPADELARRFRNLGFTVVDISILPVVRISPEKEKELHAVAAALPRIPGLINGLDHQTD